MSQSDDRQPPKQDAKGDHQSETPPESAQELTERKPHEPQAEGPVESKPVTEGDPAKADTSAGQTVAVEPTVPATEEPAPSRPARDEAYVQPQKATSAKRSWLWLPMVLNGLLTLVLVVLIVLLGWRFYPQWGALQGQVGELAEEQALLVQADRELKQGQQALAAAEAETLARAESMVKPLQDNLRAVGERLDAHNQRLLSLSNTSREDWLLAEAQYLLRLASQRLLVDRQASSALGLMESVDGILRDLAMPDLFAVRQALATDLAAVRLAAAVDREGIYLRLAGLINSLDSLPTYDTPIIEGEALELPSEPEPATEDEPEVGFWQSVKAFPGVVWRWLKGVGVAIIDKISSYVRIQDHEYSASPLLPPSTAEYLRQNVRLSLEQAQVAMLREQTEIYRASLGQAIDLVERYFPDTPGRQALLQELLRLQGLTVDVTLPSITSSLGQLAAFIERLHQLEGASSQAEAP